MADLSNENDQNMVEKPFVSVSVLTYQHSDFIEKCLDSILMQKTNFLFEILVHDDASTDGTEEIIREYESNYPNLIRPIYEEENQWRIGKRGSAIFNFPRARGKYIALCEGDDYWTDPLKLQKQVGFLEENEDYILSHTNCDHLIEKKNKIIKRANEDYQSLDLSTPEKRFEAVSSHKLRIKTPTVIFRNESLEEFHSHKKFKMGDTPLWFFLSHKGKFHYLNEPTAVYRIGLNTASKATNRVRKLKFKLSGIEMRFYYHKKYEYQVSDKLKSQYYTTLKNLILITGNSFELNENYLSENQIINLKHLPRISKLKRMALYTMGNFKSALVDVRNKLELR